MKDIQGYYRGKCNSCECQEYMEPPTDSSTTPDKPRRLRCEYCNHTPVEHVWIIELGECTKCGANNCDKYESDEKNSYTDCGYCGCNASDHKGASKLKRNTPAAATAAVAPRIDISGNPVQSVAFGLCKRQGCQFSRRKEGGTVHEYCSRTCAKKDQAASHQSFLPFTAAQGPASTTRGQGQPTPATTTGSISSGLTLCSNCNHNPPNPGYPWCLSCYSMHEAQTPKKK